MRRGRARLRARLLLLLTALALVVAPVAARAHLHAAASLGTDVCTTADGKSPASGGAHAEHCQCCNGSPIGPPSAGATASILPFESPGAAAPVATPRAARIVAARPRGPPAPTVVTH